jgi:hypothetical protein
MITPIIERILPVYPEYMHIQWSISDPNGFVGNIELARSGSPEGPFTVLEQNLPKDTFFYQDFEVAKNGLSQNYWYRLRVSSSANPEEKVLSLPVTVEYKAQPHRFRLARKARRDLYITLSRLNGSVFMVLKKKRFGPRCTTCFNTFTQDVVVSTCGECYSTGYQGGFHDPISIWGKIDPTVIQQQFGTQGISEMARLGFVTLDYPLLDLEDILIEIQTNRRFKVLQKVQTESSNIVVHQDLQLSELSRTAIEYSIPVDLTNDALQKR